MTNYGNPRYWDERYKECEGDMYDWLEDFKSLESLLTQYVKKDSRILILGCGNANLSEDMYDAGYTDIWNIDISSVVIHQMRERNKHRCHMYYEQMDVCDLKYPDNFFDIAIDKSTIDALLCGDNAFVLVALMMKETQRVLKENGHYIGISYGKPSTRSFHYKRNFLSWALKEYSFAPQNDADLTE